MSKKRDVEMKISDLQQAEGAVAEYARLAVKLKGLEVEEADEHLGIKARYEAQRAPAETRMKTLEAALKQFSVMNRTAVFGERQSRELTFGTLEFRRSTKTVQMSGVKAEDTLARVESLGFVEAVNIKKSFRLEAMENWTDERLALVGRRRVQSESFRIVPHEDVSA